MNVEQVYWPWVVSISTKDGLVDAAWKMREFDTGAVVVLAGDGRLVGIVTERDLLRAYVDGADLRQTPVLDYMTASPQTISIGTDVVEAACLFKRIGARHLPVMAGDLVAGMLSARDLLGVIATSAVESAARSIVS
jgi:CBS domain-containing protein